MEILIHIGMDTVKLNGDGFKAHAAQGDRVRKGQLLVEFDMEKIKQAGYSLTTPVIISNTPAYQAVTVLAQTGDGAGTEKVRRSAVRMPALYFHMLTKRGIIR